MKKKGYFHGSSLKFARVVTMMYLQWWMKSAPKKTKTTASINNRQPPGRYVTYTAQKEQENKKKTPPRYGNSPFPGLQNNGVIKREKEKIGACHHGDT